MKRRGLELNRVVGEKRTGAPFTFTGVFNLDHSLQNPKWFQ
jgi:hypothetical protein